MHCNFQWKTLSITFCVTNLWISNHISVYVCDCRPFQRTVTMHKDSSGHVGFIYKSGKITSLVKDGSAARNGLLTEHYICEINGQNVIGLKVRRSSLCIQKSLLRMNYSSGLEVMCYGVILSLCQSREEHGLKWCNIRTIQHICDSHNMFGAWF